MLKTLMLRKKLDDKKKLLEELRKKAEGFAIREADLEQSITEAETEEEDVELDQFEDHMDDDLDLQKDDYGDEAFHDIQRPDAP